MGCYELCGRCPRWLQPAAGAARFTSLVLLSLEAHNGRLSHSEQAYGGVMGFASTGMSNTEVLISKSNFTDNFANGSQVC